MKWASSFLVLITAFVAGCTSPVYPPGPAPTSSTKVETATSAIQSTHTLPAVTSPTSQVDSPTATVPAQASGAFPAQPEGVPFPTRDWQEGDWPMGVDRVGIDRAVDIALANGRAQRVRAVVIVHGGKIVYERYSPNDADGPAKIMPGYSIAKSITSALVGILVRDGRLAVQDLAPIPAWSTPGDSRQEVTVEHLLRMSSGLKWDTEGFTNRGDDQHRMLTSDDAAAYIAEKELIYKPGDIFFYNSGNFILLDRIMADIVGSGHAFQEFMRSELLDKIGLTRLELKFDRQGTWLGSYAADTTARYFAKFGLLYLRDGVWNGERILPEGWVEYSRTPSPANPEYGAGWWLDLHRPGVFYAVGVRGQVITVDPAHDLTFVTLATDSLASLPVSEAILNAFREGE